ncbi:MAG: phosphoribosylanthranilate isomerase [Brevinematia bacterium]
MKIKFCGLTRVEDVEFAIKLGVDFQGFILFRGSKRFVSPSTLDNIFKKVHNGNFVGVFVNEDIEKVLRLSRTYNFTFVQLHGDESPDYTRKILDEGIPTIKAFRVKGEEEILKIKETPSEFILLDAFVEGTYGGTGKTIDFNILDKIFSKIIDKRIFLSGGVNINNIEEIMKNFGKYIYALDISSGIEESPGIKSHSLMEEVYNKFKTLRQLLTNLT